MLINPVSFKFGEHTKRSYRKTPPFHPVLAASRQHGGKIPKDWTVSIGGGGNGDMKLTVNTPAGLIGSYSIVSVVVDGKPLVLPTRGKPKTDD